MFRYRVVGTDEGFMTTFVTEVCAWNRRAATRKAIRMAESRRMGEGTYSVIVRRKGFAGWKTLCVVGHVIEYADED